MPLLFMQKTLAWLNSDMFRPDWSVDIVQPVSEGAKVALTSAGEKPPRMIEAGRVF
jgi:hypothetical protein